MHGKFKLRYIFIPVLAVLLMSHNVGAESFAQSVLYIRSSTNPAIQAGGNCSADGNNAIKGTQTGCVASGLIVTLPYNEYLKGDIIEIDLNIIHYEDNNALNAWLFKMQADSTNIANTPVALINIDYQSITQNTGIAKFYIMVGAYTNNMPTVGLSGNIFLYNHDFLSVSTTTCWRPVTDSSQAIINAINNSSTDLSNVEDKIDDVITAIEDAQEQNQEYQEQEQQAIENIENQTPEDISQDGSTENSQTSSLLATVGSFLSAITNVQSGTCVVTVPMPNFAGGQFTVNICQGKDKTGNLVSIFGSVALVVFYIPLAWKLISMIYSEIRSFTNG